jgi:hypothetical protein
MSEEELIAIRSQSDGPTLLFLFLIIILLWMITNK